VIGKFQSIPHFSRSAKIDDGPAIAEFGGKPSVAATAEMSSEHAVDVVDDAQVGNRFCRSWPRLMFHKEN